MTTLLDRMRDSMGGDIPALMRAAEVIDMTPIMALPRIDWDDRKISAYAQCMPSDMPLWFESSFLGARLASIVAQVDGYPFWHWEPLAETSREIEDASYCIIGMAEQDGRLITGAPCAVYLDSDFNVDEVTFYRSPSGPVEDLVRLDDAERSLMLRTGQWDTLREMTQERIAADRALMHAAVIPTLQALSLLAHGIATLDDRPASRNRAKRRSQRRSNRGSVRTMRLHAPTGQTEADRRQSLHWRAEHWAPADRGDKGRFVAKGTGQDEMIWHPGRWVGDPAIGAT
jgi:hypothetical protein